MSKKTQHRPLTPEEVKQKAKKAIESNPIYIHDEPAIVGSPKSLTEDQEEEDNDEPTDRKDRSRGPIRA